MRYLILVSYFFLLILSSTSYAAIDPWYEQNPSYVIDKGNPARTGEYKTESLLKFHHIIWNKELKGRLTPIYFNNQLIIGGPTAWNFNNSREL